MYRNGHCIDYHCAVLLLCAIAIKCRKFDGFLGRDKMCLRDVVHIISFRVTKLCYYFPNELFILLHLDISLYTNTRLCAFGVLIGQLTLALQQKEVFE